MLFPQVKTFLDSVVDRFTRFSDTPQVVVMSGPGSFVTRGINPIGNLPVARDSAQLTTLQADTTLLKVLDLESHQLYRREEGTWKLVDISQSPDPDYNRHTLIFSPPDHRFYYVDGDYAIHDVDVSASTN